MKNSNNDKDNVKTAIRWRPAVNGRQVAVEKIDEKVSKAEKIEYGNNRIFVFFYLSLFSADFSRFLSFSSYFNMLIRNTHFFLFRSLAFQVDKMLRRQHLCWIMCLIALTVHNAKCMMC